MSESAVPTNNLLRRELGVSEDIIDTLNSLGAYIFSVVLFLDCKKEFNSELIQQSLTVLQSRHPFLRTTIRTEKGKRWYEPMRKPVLDFALLEQNSDWECTYTNSLSELFDTERGPLWRVRAIPSTSEMSDDVTNSKGLKHPCYTMVFSFYHAIMDGFSCGSLCKQFVSILDSLIENSTKQYSSDFTYPMLPAMEDLLPESDVTFGCLDTGAVLGYAANMMFPPKHQFLEKYPAQMTTESRPQTMTKVLRFSLSKSETETLLKSCKLKKVSVHGALTSAASMAMAHIVGDKAVNVRSRHTVDVRKFTDPPVEHCHMGYVVSTMDASIRVKNNSMASFWGYAKKANKQIQRGIYFKDYTKPVRIARKLYKREAFMKQTERTIGVGGRDDKYFTMTNLGCLDRVVGDLNTTNVEMRDILVGTGIHKLGPVYLHNVLTMKDQLQWYLSYATNITTTDQAVKYLHAIHIVLLQALKEMSSCT